MWERKNEKALYYRSSDTSGRCPDFRRLRPSNNDNATNHSATGNNAPTTTPTPTPIATLTLTPTPTSTPTPTPTPTPSTTETPTTSPSLIDGDWISNETNTGIAAGPILQFKVGRNGVIISLTVSVFPIPSEWFLWFIDKPLDIQENRFICSTSSLPASSGQGEFVLEGKFTAPNRCEGTMKFPKGFFWVDFALDHDVTFTWTAHPK